MLFSSNTSLAQENRKKPLSYLTNILKEIHTKSFAKEKLENIRDSTKRSEQKEVIKRDIKMLHMRKVLDPSHHYKKIVVNPESAQLGTILETPLHYYSSSHLSKKQRKATSLVDSLMKDENLNKALKKKYIQIQYKKQYFGKSSFKKSNEIKNKKK